MPLLADDRRSSALFLGLLGWNPPRSGAHGLHIETRPFTPTLLALSSRASYGPESLT